MFQSPSGPPGSSRNVFFAPFQLPTPRFPCQTFSCPDFTSYLFLLLQNLENTKQSKVYTSYLKPTLKLTN
ncbi:hypothetical protein HanIR_Chr04g0164141 [Helianthus annuus]|nr:hypothetical protein HanIR_Chr04g0164141 [Helianthus annuus]